MRVFVTGATGFVGTAVVKELIGAGHGVLGLSRSDAGAKQLTAAGAEVHRGSLEDIESLKAGAAGADGVIHLAFIHDFTGDYNVAVRADVRAIEAMTDVLAGSNKPFIATSGTLGLPPGGAEDASPSTHLPRKSEEAGLAAVTKGLRAMVIRLSPSVHGDFDHGFVPALIKTAREKGFSSYVGDGKNRWPAVHVNDAAKLYRLALENGKAGARYHGVGDPGIPLRDIAEAIARKVNVPAVSKTAEEATALLGFIGMVLGMDGATTSTLTQERLGWTPTGVGLLEDLENGKYFE